MKCLCQVVSLAVWITVIHVSYHIWDINLTVQYFGIDYKHCMRLVYQSTSIAANLSVLNVLNVQDPTSNNIWSDGWWNWIYDTQYGNELDYMFYMWIVYLFGLGYIINKLILFITKYLLSTLLFLVWTYLSFIIFLFLFQKSRWFLADCIKLSSYRIIRSTCDKWVS